MNIKEYLQQTDTDKYQRQTTHCLYTQI